MDYKAKIDELDGWRNHEQKTDLEEAIEELQNELGIDLPESYVSFLPSGGGVSCVGVSFQTSEDASTTLDFFYGLTGQDNDLSQAYERFKDRLSPEFLPIARDEPGNQVLLNLEDETIHFFDHENEGEEEAVTPLADDLDGWLESLSVEVIENEEDS